MNTAPMVLGVGAALPRKRFTQAEIAEALPGLDRRNAAFFRDRHIASRHLHVPALGDDGRLRDETQGELLARHLDGALEIGAAAAREALEDAGCPPEAVDHLACVTSTGFLTPGLTARLLPVLGFRRDLHRQDVVGMGCNAGLNGMQVGSWFAAAHPGTTSLLLCVEICSAAYVRDDSVSTAVVNSLFGDGAAAAVVRADARGAAAFAPRILGFESHVVPEALLAMRYDWDDGHGKFSFFLDRDVPLVVGAAVPVPVSRLLERFGLRQRQVAHWIVHSGGRKVIDSIKYNLGLTDHDVRHTLSVLKECGNVSSASFLFTLKRLLAERVARRGDVAVAITMGPGVTIETALLQW